MPGDRRVPAVLRRIRMRGNRNRRINPASRATGHPGAETDLPPGRTRGPLGHPGRPPPRPGRAGIHRLKLTDPPSQAGNRQPPAREHPRRPKKPVCRPGPLPGYPRKGPARHALLPAPPPPRSPAQQRTALVRRPRPRKEESNPAVRRPRTVSGEVRAGSARRPPPPRGRALARIRSDHRSRDPAPRRRRSSRQTPCKA